MHHFLLKVGLHLESPRHGLIAQHLTLLISEGSLIELYHHGELVSIIVQINEPIIEQKARVALLPVRVVNLITPSDVLNCLNNEASPLVRIGPGGLPGSLMIQHVRIGNETISFDAFNVDAENARGNHHANLTVLFKTKLAILGNLLDNQVIVGLDIFDFLGDLVLEGRPIKPISLLLRVKDGEVVEAFGQDVDVLFEITVLLSLLLHNVRG